MIKVFITLDSLSPGNFNGKPIFTTTRTRFFYFPDFMINIMIERT